MSLSFNVYLRGDTVYAPALAKIDVGHFMEVEPVGMAPVSDEAAVSETIRRAFAAGNPPVAHPTRGNWPKSVLLKYAGCKTWMQFQRRARLWSVEQDGNLWRVTPNRVRPDGRGLEEDTEAAIHWTGLSAAEAACRMAGLVAGAAR